MERLTQFTKNRLRTRLNRSLAILVLFVVIATTFAKLIDGVREGETLAFDSVLLRFINQTATPVWDQFYQIITIFGGTLFIAGATIILAFVLLYKGRFAQAIFVTLYISGAGVINTFMKYTIGRERPSLWEQLITETSHAFPSGHAVGSSALALALIIISWRTKCRWLVVAGGVTYTFLIGYSRLYLGVHYPSDVVGGWLLALLWALALLGAWGARRKWLAKQPK